MEEMLQGWKRTALCADITDADIGDEVTLMGWVDARHDLGSLIFIDLRDRSGLMQIVFDKSTYGGNFETVESLRREYVIADRGKVVRRSDDTINPKIPTGYIEVRADALKVLSRSETPPFEIEDDTPRPRGTAAEIPLPRSPPAADAEKPDAAPPSGCRDAPLS